MIIDMINVYYWLRSNGEISVGGSAEKRGSYNGAPFFEKIMDSMFA
jgi:hypothetical protein